MVATVKPADNSERKIPKPLLEVPPFSVITNNGNETGCEAGSNTGSQTSSGAHRQRSGSHSTLDETLQRFQRKVDGEKGSDDDRPRGWLYLRANREKILKLGNIDNKGQGFALAQLLSDAERRISVDPTVTTDVENSRPDYFVQHTYHHDTSIIHSAIPFLPVPAAFTCCVMNFIFPGTGTIISGFLLLCIGQPRVNHKESRVALSIVLNFFVGLAQLCTITFLFVGWYWSITWGSLMVIRSFEYMQAIQDSKREVLATVAIEALTKDSVLRKTHVTRLVREARGEYAEQKQSSSTSEDQSNHAKNK